MQREAAQHLEAELWLTASELQPHDLPTTTALECAAQRARPSNDRSKGSLDRTMRDDRCGRIDSLVVSHSMLASEGGVYALFDALDCLSWGMILRAEPSRNHQEQVGTRSSCISSHELYQPD